MLNILWSSEMYQRSIQRRLQRRYTDTLKNLPSWDKLNPA
jgi:hypothetical protein